MTDNIHWETCARLFQLTPPWLLEVYNLVDKNQPDEAIDLVLEHTDILLSDGRFEECDKLLCLVDATRLDSNLHVCFLSAVHRARGLLPHYDAFVARLSREAWVYKTYQLVRSGDTQGAVDAIYDGMENLLNLSPRYADDLLLRIDPSRLNEESIQSILMATYAASHLLPNRTDFIARTKPKIKLTKEEVQRLLKEGEEAGRAFDRVTRQMRSFTPEEMKIRFK